MEEYVDMKPKAKGLVTCSVAFLSGLCNALIGAGGGILLALALSRLGADGLSAKKDIYVNAQAAMIPGCILSCVIYAALGSLDPSGFSVYAIPAALCADLTMFCASALAVRLLMG